MTTPTTPPPIVPREPDPEVVPAPPVAETDDEIRLSSWDDHHVPPPR